jgi:hypothetical protein
MERVHCQLMDCGYIRNDGTENVELTDCARQLPAGTKVVIEEKSRQLRVIEMERMHREQERMYRERPHLYSGAPEQPEPLSSDEILDHAFQAIRNKDI